MATERAEGGSGSGQELPGHRRGSPHSSRGQVIFKDFNIRYWQAFTTKASVVCKAMELIHNTSFY